MQTHPPFLASAFPLAHDDAEHSWSGVQNQHLNRASRGLSSQFIAGASRRLNSQDLERASRDLLDQLVTFSKARLRLGASYAALSESSFVYKQGAVLRCSTTAAQPIQASVMHHGASPALPNHSLKLSANGVSRWPSGAGASPHFAPAVQRATPLSPA